MSLLQNSNAISAGGYDINNSLRFRSNASAASTAYLTRTPASNTNRTTWTWSAWVKRAFLSSSGETTLFGAAINSGDRILISFYQDKLLMYAVSGGVASTVSSAAVYRDPSAWYHVVVAMDTTQATASNRSRLYINGTEITSFATSTRPNQNQTFAINSTNEHQIGRNFDGTSQVNFMDGYLAEVNFIDGQALTPSSFGETDAVTGSWVAKKYTGTYGINGFYLPFSDTDSNENRFLYSEDFANAAWSKGGSTLTSNTVVAPNGTTTADTLTDNATTDQHLVVQTIAIPSVGSQYTVSIYAKANTRSQIGLTMHGEGYAVFDLSAGTVISTGGYSNVGMISVGNGWYRCYVTITKTNDNGNVYYIIFKDGVNPYLGTGTGSIYIWGAQVKYGSTLGKYIATTTAAVTNQGTTENLLTYSEQFDNAAWAKFNLTATANTVVAPNGATVADTLFETTTNGEHYTERSLTPVTNTHYVFSTYAKYLNRKYLALRIVYSNGAQDTLAIFDIQNGTYYGYDGSAPTATSITSVGNGWYRISATFTTPATNPTASLLFRYQFRDDSLTGNYAGNTSVGVYLWGAQLETQGTLGPYFSTIGAAQSLGHRIGADRSLGSTSFGYNSWIPNNLSLIPGTTYDAMTDSPTNTSATVANYAVLNPLVYDGGIADTYSQANLSVVLGNTTTGKLTWSTMSMSSGKWYVEFIINTTSTAAQYFGLIPIANTLTNRNTGNTNVGANSGEYAYGRVTATYATGTTYINGTITNLGTTLPAVGNVIGLAFDATAGTMACYLQNVLQTTITGIPAGEYFFALSAAGYQSTANFGQRPFAYTPPTGFLALNTYNLPDSTIKKGNKYMDATLYTGNTTGQTITNAGAFKPDFVWLKVRSTAASNVLTDSVRGVSKQLFSNLTNAETTEAGKGVTSFNSNGFTLGGELLVTGSSNNNGDTYVGWQWQAGQGTTSSNTSGSITSTVSVNTTAGFSVVTYTGNGTAGATIGHGLGVAPSMVIIKRRNASYSWAVLHTSVGFTGDSYLGYPEYYMLYLDSTMARSNFGSDTIYDPTSTTIRLGSGGSMNDVNASGSTYVAYCWAEIAGFSKFGSYTGNGSSDGPMIFTGFKPKFVMFKRTDTTSGWYIHDSTRNTSNVVNLRLLPNTSDAEATVTTLDFLSNGFKLRTSDVDRNASGGTYIYACFASNPFKNSNAV